MCHVLIIEDEWLIAELISHHLESLGATSFDYAMTQSEAVALAIAHVPQVITSDVKLIEGTGPLAIKVIHQEVGPVPIIYITATPDECEPCEHSVAILSKPLTGGVLADAFALAWTAP
jgi:CheY-like chemotaxis protein